MTSKHQPDKELLRAGIEAAFERRAGLTAAEAWVLPVEAELAPALIDLILERLRGRQAA